MMNAVFWDVAPCRSCANRRFLGTYRLHLQGRKISVSRLLQTASHNESGPNHHQEIFMKCTTRIECGSVLVVININFKLYNNIFTYSCFLNNAFSCSDCIASNDRNSTE
jgi:hypothetical protein